MAVQGKIAKSSRMVGALRPISVTDKPNSQKKNIEDFNTISNPHQWSLIEPWTQCYFQAHRKHLQKKKTLLESTRRREISQQIPTIPFHTIVPDHSHEPSKLQMFGHLNFFLKKCITQIRNHIEMKPI